MLTKEKKGIDGIERIDRVDRDIDKDRRKMLKREELSQGMIVLDAEKEKEIDKIDTTDRIDREKDQHSPHLPFKLRLGT